MKKAAITLTLALTLLPAFAAAEQVHRINPATKVETWEVSNHGVHFALTQILPDQVRAFYINRGFSQEQIESYATSCVYMTVLRNDKAPAAIHFVSNDWRIVISGIEKPLVPVDAWVDRLSKTGAKKPALIAFRWAQFPPEQEYQPGGDWNQGMLSIGLPPASTFDIAAKWDMNGKNFEASLRGVKCAK